MRYIYYASYGHGSTYQDTNWNAFCGFLKHCLDEGQTIRSVWSVKNAKFK